MDDGAEKYDHHWRGRCPGPRRDQTADVGCANRDDDEHDLEGPPIS